ncbi:hypothetical protein ACJW30_05G135900 [Castanea mollissima]
MLKACLHFIHRGTILSLILHTRSCNVLVYVETLWSYLPHQVRINYLIDGHFFGPANHIQMPRIPFFGTEYFKQ